MLTNNCADFARIVSTFIFPAPSGAALSDAGVTTPKQIAYKLERYARKHPETQLTVLEIPQIPGYRRHSRSNKGVAESLTTTGYAVPIVGSTPTWPEGYSWIILCAGAFILSPSSRGSRPGNLSPLTASARPLKIPSAPVCGPPAPLKAAPTRLRSRHSQLRPERNQGDA